MSRLVLILQGMCRRLLDAGAVAIMFVAAPWVELFQDLVHWLTRLGRSEPAPPPRIVVTLSGPIRAGKSSVRQALQRSFDAIAIRTRDVLESEYAVAIPAEVRAGLTLPQADRTAALRREIRRELQDLGEQLDRETRGGWVASAVRRETLRMPMRRMVVVDAVRLPKQVDLLREDETLFVVPIYLDAPRPVLERRFEDGDYEEVLRSPTERNVAIMREGAWLTLNTGWLPERLTAVTVVALLHAVRGWVVVRDVPTAFAAGAIPAAVLVSPAIWFASTWHPRGLLVNVVEAMNVALFALAATLIGGALTKISPLGVDVSVSDAPCGDSRATSESPS
jgi:hypothetical protein